MLQHVVYLLLLLHDEPTNLLMTLVEYMFQFELLGLLVLAWVLVYFCIWRSVKVTGKVQHLLMTKIHPDLLLVQVVYFTATLPYFLLITFTVRGITLEGADKGLAFLFSPDWHQVLEPRVSVSLL